jgi:hypothetical protein
LWPLDESVGLVELSPVAPSTRTCRHTRHIAPPTQHCAAPRCSHIGLESENDGFDGHAGFVTL